MGLNEEVIFLRGNVKKHGNIPDTFHGYFKLLFAKEM